MRWRFCRASTDRAEHDRVGYVLRRNRLQKLRGRWQPHSGDFDQELSGEPQTRGHIKGIVEVRVVDEPFPANRGAWLFEIDTHHNQQPIGHSLRQLQQPARVVASCIGIVDRTGSHNDQQTGIIPGQHAFYSQPAGHNRASRSLAQRQNRGQPRGRHERLEALDPQIGCRLRRCVWRSLGGGVHATTLHYFPKRASFFKRGPRPNRRDLTVLPKAGSIHFERRPRRDCQPRAATRKPPLKKRNRERTSLA